MREAQAAPGHRKPRDVSLDIYRGICICEVVTHHVTGMALRKVAQGSTLYELIYLVNRTLHFAVPAFLFIMGVLLTQTMLGKQRTWREFYSRRARQTLLPYLLWTVFYVCFRVFDGLEPAAVLNVLAHPGRWKTWLLWGRGWFHLYFMVLALQLYLVFPLLLGLIRRLRPSFPLFLLLCLAGQWGGVWLGKSWLHPQFPATLLWAHLVAAGMGVWVGVNLKDWEALWGRIRVLAVLAAVLGAYCYLPLGLPPGWKLPVNPVYGMWAYTGGVIFCLLAFARFLARREGRLPAAFRYLGLHSMPIYLLHPLLLHYWDKVNFRGGSLGFVVTIGLVWASVMGACLLASRLADRLGVGEYVFGRTGGAAGPRRPRQDRTAEPSA